MFTSEQASGFPEQMFSRRLRELRCSVVCAYSEAHHKIGHYMRAIS